MWLGIGIAIGTSAGVVISQAIDAPWCSIGNSIWTNDSIFLKVIGCFCLISPPENL